MGWWCKHQECTIVKLLQYDAEDDFDDNIYEERVGVILFQDDSKNRQQRISFFVSYQNMIFNKNKQKTIKDQNYIFDVLLVMKYKMM